MDAILNFSTRLLYTDICTAGREWQYKNIISPFTRMYLIKGGKGTIYINQIRYELTEGDLFIIPKFTNHSYECDNFIEHYYICFFDEMIGQRSIFDIVNLKFKLRATELDYSLFERIVQINSKRAIPHKNPKMYDNKKSCLPFNSFRSIDEILNDTENNGIIMQILSRFFDSCKLKSQCNVDSMHNRFTPLINYINNNLSAPLKVSDLAAFTHLSPDHFTRVFKRIMGITANQYIQEKRIERAQALLITSRFTIQEISATVGIYNTSQFSSLFKKITGYSPREYIKNQIDYQRK